MEALGDAYEKGYFGDMEMAVIPVDSEECDKLAEHEGVEVLPTTCVYSHGKRWTARSATSSLSMRGLRCCPPPASIPMESGWRVSAPRTRMLPRATERPSPN